AVTSTMAGSQTGCFRDSNQDVCLSDMVAVTGAAGSVNEGTVTFAVFQGATQIGVSVTSGTVSGGNASATYVLPGGTAQGMYSIHGIYNPSVDYTGSIDNTHTLTVNQAGTTTTAANQTAAFSSVNQNVTLSAMVAATGGA